ncbi:Acetyl-CoA carboxylase, carboxyltransferase component [Lachnospiraceae bacterium RM5]|nr:Acetyl-CoA carboxylase, carboxyltransferase component [Lachnospiraceae bacterium RM5]
MSTTSSLSASERIMDLLDDNSFVEIGGLVEARNTDFNLSKKETPADGVVTGYGLINDKLVYVYSQNVSVLGGAIGEMHAKKIVRIYDMALKMGAPVIGLIDCAGLRLEEATDALNAFAKIYRRQALASGVIPQICAVFGNCGGGASVMTSLCDFTYMTNDAHLFVNSPNVLDGNNISKNDTSSLEFQKSKTMNVDFEGTEEEVLQNIRELVDIIPANNEDDLSYEETNDDPNRVCEGIDGNIDDIQELIKELSDDNVFVETKKEYALSAVTGFIRLNGHTVGVIANNSDLLSNEGVQKMEEFVRFLDAFSIPVVTLVNATGFETTIEEEMALSKNLAKLAYALSIATIPKISVILNNAFGTPYMVMNSKGLGADMVFAWENTTIGMMDSEAAVKIIYSKDIDKATDANVFIAEKTKEYRELESSANQAAKRGYVDSIISPEDTRKYLIGTLEMLYTKRDFIYDKKHGTV